MSQRTTSFVAPRARPIWPIALLLLALSAGLAAGTIYLWTESRKFVDNHVQLEKSIARTQSTIERLSADEEAMLNHEELQTTAAEINFFNALSGQRHGTIFSLLEGLERLVPAKVWLHQLTYDAENGKLLLSLRAESEIDLPQALSRIESDAAFNQVILERQLRVQQANRALVQYDIEAVVP